MQSMALRHLIHIYNGILAGKHRPASIIDPPTRALARPCTASLLFAVLAHIIKERVEDYAAVQPLPNHFVVWRKYIERVPL